MRAILVAVPVALAACSDPPGLTLEVVPGDPAITEVQLFVGEHCPDCPTAMAPPGLLARSTDIYLVNDTRAYLGEWRGDRVGFRLTTTGADDEHVPILIAIGFDQAHTPRATSTIRNVTVPAGRAEYWQTFLEAATPIVDPDPDASGERVALWPAMRNGPQCVMVEHGTSGADTVVPKDDTDCDGVSSTLECAPFTPNAVRQPPTVGAASCVAWAQSNLSGQICLLGGRQCTESNPTTSPCEALDVDYCAPALLCSACAGLTSDNWDTCARLKLTALDTNSTLMPAMGCTIPMEASGAQCADTSKLHATLDAAQFLPRDGSSNVKCTEIAISEMTLPLSFHHSLPIGAATLTLKNFQQDCKVDVEWSGDYTRIIGTHVLVADIELDNGKHMTVPFVLHANDSCDGSMQCNVVVPDPSDTIFQCARPAPSTTTCAGTSLCFDGTPCGARCCATGEACVDGVCQCGDGPHCVADDVCTAGGLTGGCGKTCCGTSVPCPTTP
ncbi:MAG TPA: hypothetical protein VLB44_25315 [Kofleriaceae bacterium]|nr:hypothetical protein [Kofleriaceae bacterium]